jgi:hypothetical protein
MKEHHVGRHCAGGYGLCSVLRLRYPRPVQLLEAGIRGLGPGICPYEVSTERGQGHLGNGSACRLISLPCLPELTEPEIERVCDAL